MNNIDLHAAGMADRLPLASRGPWTIERVTPTDSDLKLNNLRALFSGGGRGYVREGRPITMLKHEQRGIVMSDTPDEMNDLWPFRAALMSHPRPIRVLINGLGLGCAVRMALACPWVGWIDVVEIDPDIAALTTFDDDRVHVHVGDAFTINLEGEWDVVWHDVWDVLTTANLSQSPTDKAAGDPDHSIARLMRRYGRRTNWQGAWGHEFLKARKRQERDAWWTR